MIIHADGEISRSRLLAWNAKTPALYGIVAYKRLTLTMRPGTSEKTGLWIILEIISKQFSAMFVLVAVNAKIFPVRAIRGVVPVISIFMVHG